MSQRPLLEFNSLHICSMKLEQLSSQSSLSFPVLSSRLRWPGEGALVDTGEGQWLAQARNASLTRDTQCTLKTNTPTPPITDI